MIVASRAPLGSQSNAVRDCPLPSPFFLTPASSSQQLHSKQFTRPLFSYSYALICTASSRIPILFNRFRTLCANHPGWGYYLRPALPAYARQRSQPQSLQPFTARFSGYPGGGVSDFRQLPRFPASAIIDGLTNAVISTSAPQRGYSRSHDAA